MKIVGILSVIREVGIFAVISFCRLQATFFLAVNTPKAAQVNTLPAKENDPIVRNNTVTKDDQGLNGTLNSSMIRHRKGKLTC